MVRIENSPGKKVAGAARRSFFAACVGVCAIMAIIGVRSSVVAAGPDASGANISRFDTSKAGTAAPGTVFTGPDGSEKTLTDFKGRLVLVNLWATWCAPCVTEMPSLDRLQAKLGGTDFTVLALSEDRAGWEKIAPFREKHGLDRLPLYHDVGSAMMFATKSASLPTTILYGRDGKEIGRLGLPAEWDSSEAVALIRRHMGE